MNPLSLATIATMSGASLLAGSPDAQVARVCKDTRLLSPGDLYIPLRGDRFDGHQFIQEAASKGAVATFCDSAVPAGLPLDFGILKTSDVLNGLKLFATSWRSRLNLNPVVITGSSGKTSVKDFTATILATRFFTTATQGNWNNHIGLPLSILEANLQHKAAVWEIGMNHRGEIASLASLAKPHIGIITGIGSAHIEFFGSKKNIAIEKRSLLQCLPSDGFAVIPAEDMFAQELREGTNAQVLSVGFDHGDLRALPLSHDLGGSHFIIEGSFGRAEVFLPVFGRHMIANALMAVAAGILHDIPLDECAAALEKVILSSGRLTQVVKRGVNMIDDTYNANPDSMLAALKALASLDSSGRKIAVLGKMEELGIHAAESYRALGEIAAVILDTLICVGDETSILVDVAKAEGLKNVHHVSSNSEAAELLSSISQAEDLVLLKASRSAHLEEVIHQFI